MQNCKLIQEFECLVIRANDKIIECEMHDLTRCSPVEYAEIFRSAFENFDTSVLIEGRVFYWKIFKNEKFYENYFSEFQLREDRIHAKL